MVKFKNILTKHIFTLPEDKAIEIITQSPEVYEIISGLDKDFISSNIKQDLSEIKDIYTIVVEDDDTEYYSSQEKTPETEIKKRKTRKTASKRKEKK